MYYVPIINRRAIQVSLLLAILPLLNVCASLDTVLYAEQSALDDSVASVTVIQEIGPGTMLHTRGSGFGGVMGQTYTLGYAAAVAARGNDVFVVDRLAGNLIHISLTLNEARVLTTLPDPNTHGVYVARDLTVYVVDKFNRAVRELNDAGQTTRLYADPTLMPAPVDVAETGWGGDIVVADALNSQLVMFDALAGAFDVIGSSDSRQSLAQTMHAIAATRNSVYVLDTGIGEVTRFGLRGNPIGNYGEDELQMPTALAVDRCGRLFIADQSGQGILVSLSDMMLPAARAQNSAMIADEITDLWVDEDFLYVAAGTQGIKILLIEPRCPA